MLLLSRNSTIGSQNQRMGVIAQIAPLAESVPPIMVRRNGARGRVADRRAMAVGYSASPAGRSRRVSADRPRLRRVLGPRRNARGMPPSSESAVSHGYSQALTYVHRGRDGQVGAAMRMASRDARRKRSFSVLIHVQRRVIIPLLEFDF
jgi:hypothetical protein